MQPGRGLLVVVLQLIVCASRGAGIAGIHTVGSDVGSGVEAWGTLSHVTHAQTTKGEFSKSSSGSGTVLLPGSY